MVDRPRLNNNCPPLRAPSSIQNGAAARAESAATGEATLCGLYLETDEKTGLARRLEPVRIGGRLAEQGHRQAKGRQGQGVHGEVASVIRFQRKWDCEIVIVAGAGIEN